MIKAPELQVRGSCFRGTNFWAYSEAYQIPGCIAKYEDVGFRLVLENKEMKEVAGGSGGNVPISANTSFRSIFPDDETSKFIGFRLTFTGKESMNSNPNDTNISDIVAVLSARQKTHGDFQNQATISQLLKKGAAASPNWDGLDNQKQEALHMILHKVSRILCGNPNEPDHWIDIQGYARLGQSSCDNSQK